MMNRDRDLAKKLKQSMLQQEIEDGLLYEDEQREIGEYEQDLKEKYYLEDIMPIGSFEHDGQDISILGNEFDVPQEKTLNTEDFNFTGLLHHPH